jgi:hypothetical protein
MESAGALITAKKEAGAIDDGQVLVLPPFIEP